MLIAAAVMVHKLMLLCCVVNGECVVVAVVVVVGRRSKEKFYVEVRICHVATNVPQRNSILIICENMLGIRRLHLNFKK